MSGNYSDNNFHPPSNSYDNNQYFNPYMATSNYGLYEQQDQQFLNGLNNNNDAGMYTYMYQTLPYFPADTVDHSLVQNEVNVQQQQGYTINDIRPELVEAEPSSRAQKAQKRRIESTGEKRKSTATKRPKRSCPCEMCMVALRQHCIPNQNFMHQCPVPGCMKSYAKSSHLKAHCRWHGQNSFVNQPHYYEIATPPDQIQNRKRRAVEEVPLPDNERKRQRGNKRNVL